MRSTQWISIHAPLAGCDFRRACKNDWWCISIHAPLAGCDYLSGSSKCRRYHFNPRTPCGVRLIFKSCFIHSTDFNPRTPCGVRPAIAANLNLFGKISIHAPLAGCDSKIAEIFPANLRKSYKISAKPNKERRCRVLGKGKAAAISGLARCEPPGENRNASGSHQIMSAPSGA